MATRPPVKIEGENWELVSEGQECGDRYQIVLSKATSDPTECANLALKKADCGDYFEVRVERLECRCSKKEHRCRKDRDGNTNLYKLKDSGATPTESPTESPTDIPTNSPTNTPTEMPTTPITTAPEQPVLDFTVVQDNKREICPASSRTGGWGNLGKRIKSPEACGNLCLNLDSCTHATWNEEGNGFCTAYKDCPRLKRTRRKHTVLKMDEEEVELERSELMKTYEEVEDYLLILKYKILLLDAADETSADCQKETNELEDVLWQTLDPDHNGEIDKQVFLDACNCPNLNYEALKFFQEFDRDDKSKKVITRDEFESQWHSCIDKNSRKTMLRWLMHIQAALTKEVSMKMSDVWSGFRESVEKLQELTEDLDEDLRRRLSEIDGDMLEEEYEL